MATHRRRLIGSIIAAACAAIVALPATAQQQSIVVASTTSTEPSGLFGHILPTFTRKTGIQLKVVALGTGQALDVGRRGDADVVFVHDRPAEDRFVADGWGVGCRDVMYNDFVLIGPKADPAKVAGTKDIAAALKRIAQTRAPLPRPASPIPIPRRVHATTSPGSWRTAPPAGAGPSRSWTGTSWSGSAACTASCQAGRPRWATGWGCRTGARATRASGSACCSSSCSRTSASSGSGPACSRPIPPPRGCSRRTACAFACLQPNTDVTLHPLGVSVAWYALTREEWRAHRDGPALARLHPALRALLEDSRGKVDLLVVVASPHHYAPYNEAPYRYGWDTAPIVRESMALWAQRWWPRSRSVPR